MKISPTALAAIVGRRIRQSRQARGLTQHELAALTAMNRSTLSRLESGKCSLLCLTRVDAIANALEKDITEFVTIRKITASDLAAILLENPDLPVVLKSGKRKEVLVDFQVEDDEIILVGNY